jgi:amino acid permease
MDTPRYNNGENETVEKINVVAPEIVDGGTDYNPQGLVRRALYSFTRADFQKKSSVTDTENVAPHAGDTSNLQRKLKGRHLQMIAIGGAIGAGLFIGSGRALSAGGPGALVLDFGLIGAMLFCTINALGELATLFPVQGTPRILPRLTQARSPSSQLASLIQHGDSPWAGTMQCNGWLYSRSNSPPPV